MPFPVSSIVDCQVPPVTARADECAADALTRMVEHDYSQLPVVDENNFLAGIVSAESILRAVRTFGQLPTSFRVIDCRIKATSFTPDAELFDVLASLQMENAVVIVNENRTPVGIVTDFDTSSYLRDRAENAMLVEDIELTLKEFIGLAFTQKDKKKRDSAINEAAARAAAPERDREQLKKALQNYFGEKPVDTDRLNQTFELLSAGGREPKTFEALTFAEYVKMWLSSERWDQYNLVIKLDRAPLTRMLETVNRIRNKIAHFRGDLTRAEHDALVQCRDWLQAYKPYLLEVAGQSQDVIQNEMRSQDASIEKAIQETPAKETEESSAASVANHKESSIDVEKVSKYSALGRWLRGVPSHVETTWIDFIKVEELIGVPLPPSATRHRSWWANDWTSHSQSKLWLEAGWQTDIVDMDNERVRFRRID